MTNAYLPQFENNLPLKASQTERPCDRLGVFLNTLRPGQNERQFADDVFKFVSLKHFSWFRFSVSVYVYQPTSLCSALSKVFDHIIIQRFSDKLISSDMQFSFKAQHSTVMCTCAVKEIAAHYNEKGSNVYICMLDASKAFDKVNFVKLFSLLIDRNIPGVFFA